MQIIKKIKDKFHRSYWRSYFYFVFVKSIQGNKNEPRFEDIQFKIASEADIPWICNQMDHLGDKAEKITRQQFNGNDVTIIGVMPKTPDSIIFSAWLSHSDFAFSILGDSVGTNDISIRRIWVSQFMRHKGVATKGMIFAEYVASQRGTKKIWSFVQTNNSPSLLLHEKCKFIGFGKINIFMRFGKRFANVKYGDSEQWIKHTLPLEKAKL